MNLKLSIYSALCLFTLGCANTSNQNKESYSFESRSLQIDSSFVVKSTINDFCPCKTTMPEIAKHSELKQVTVENMDAGSGCIGEDGRFENGIGYQLTTQKGMVFQQENGYEYLAKIHLNKDFSGKLPNGKEILVADLKLKDVLSMYPNFEFSSRQCAEYWSYNNDTLYFYFKLDKSPDNKPVNPRLHLDRSIEGIDIVISCFGMHLPDIKDGIFYERPIYAPLSETHVNAYVMKKRTDLAAKITEFVSLGKDTNYDYIKLGKWLVYNVDHTLQVEEYYDDKGSLMKKVK